MGDLTEHYSLAELACKCGCGYGTRASDYDPEWLEFIELRRRILARPSAPTSGKRCPSHNAAVGGVPDSAHERDAMDERIEGGWQRFEAIAATILAMLVAEGDLLDEETAHEF
jgi:zinc D-Ala-D-Ala carboxypeptidase